MLWVSIVLHVIVLLAVLEKKTEMIMNMKQSKLSPIYVTNLLATSQRKSALKLS